MLTKYSLFNLSRITDSSHPNDTIHSIYCSLSNFQYRILFTPTDVMKSEPKEQMFYTRPCPQE